MSCNIRLWSVDRAEGLFNHSSSLPLLPPSRKYQSLVKVADAAPLLCKDSAPQGGGDDKAAVLSFELKCSLQRYGILGTCFTGTKVLAYWYKSTRQRC
jgi:hypothetical protein